MRPPLGTIGGGPSYAAAASMAGWPTTLMARRLIQPQHCRAASHAAPLLPATPLGRRRLATASSSSSSSSLTLPPKRRPASVTPARQRRRDKRTEEQGDGVDLRPGAPGFEQRFAVAVRAARGPRALGRLLGRRAYLRAAPAPALATAMAVAAGMASARVAEEVVEAVEMAAAAAKRRRRRLGGGQEEGDDGGEAEQRQPPGRDATVVLLSGNDGDSSTPKPQFPLDSDQYPTRLAHCRALAAACAAELRERLRLLPPPDGGGGNDDGAAQPPPLILTPTDQARAAYSLARLGLYDPDLLDLILVRQPFFSRGSNSSHPPPPAALVGMAAALAAFSHPPPTPQWLARWRLESFRALGSFDAQQLASGAFALVRLSRLQDDEEQREGDVGVVGGGSETALAAAHPWLELASRAMRARWQEGRLSSGARAKGAGRACHPQSLVRFAVALAEASSPGGGRGGGGNSDADGESVLLSPAVGPGALADLSPLQEPHHQRTNSSIFRPSFNWLAGLCAEARRSADALAPRELAALLWAVARFSSSSASSVSPDSAFLSSWCRAASARMPAFDARSLSVAVEALAVVAGEQRGVSASAPSAPPPFEVPGRFASALLARSRPLLPRMRAERLAALLWALAALRVRPSAGWLLAWVDAFSPAAQLSVVGGPASSAAAAEAPPDSSSPPPHLPARCLADVAWALARLRLDPGPAWLRALYDAAEAAVPTASAADLAALAWAAGALPADRATAEDGGETGERGRGRPRRAWLAALGARARDAAHLAAATAGGGEKEEERRRVVDALAAFVADEVTAALPAPAAAAARPARRDRGY